MYMHASNAWRVIGIESLTKFQFGDSAGACEMWIYRITSLYHLIVMPYKTFIEEHVCQKHAIEIRGKCSKSYLKK